MKYIKHLILLSVFALLLPNTALAGRNDGQSQQSKTKKRKGKHKGKRKGKRNKLKRYPLKINARPLVLPVGLNELSANLNYSSMSVGKKDISSADMGVSFKRGVIRNLEIGGSTGLLLNPEVDWSSSFTLQGGYKIAGQRKGLSLAGQVAIPLNFGENQDIISGLRGGLATRYRLNKQVAFHTGEDVLQLTLGKESTVRINIPIGVAFQINKRINVRADTNIINFGGGGDALTIADRFPLKLRGLYTIRRAMDAGFAINKDLTNDNGWSAMGMFNYRM